jgi:hypothetical protein
MLGGGHIVYRVYLSTGAIVMVADHDVSRLRDAQRAGAQLVECSGAVNGQASTLVRINPQHVALLEKV